MMADMVIVFLREVLSMVNLMKGWSFGTRPTREGPYWTVLIFDEYNDGKPTGKKNATMRMRYFGKREEYEGWIMSDEPEDAELVWTEECGSYLNEHVYAWAPLDALPLPDLPEGIDYVVD